jgi:hypothetical protein
MQKILQHTLAIAIIIFFALSIGAYVEWWQPISDWHPLTRAGVASLIIAVLNEYVKQLNASN